MVAVVMAAAVAAGLLLYRDHSRGSAAAGLEADRTLRPQQEVSSRPAATEARIALVIGNGSYEDAPLRNPVSDARAMKAALEGCQFEVTLRVNASKREMEDAIQAFGDRIRGGSVGLFYYAGHGVAVKGANYLIPVGANLSREDDVPYEGVDVGRVLDKMDAARNQLNILILDACRNNPFARSWRSANKGLAQVSAPKGSLIAYATAPGSTAADGNGEHGLYTEALLAKLKEPGVSLLDLFQDVRAEVESRSQGQQVPWESNSTVGRFYFRPGTPAVPKPAPGATPEEGQKLQAALGATSSLPETPPGPGATRAASGLWETQLDIGLAQQRGFVAWFRRLRAPGERLHARLDLVQIHPGKFRRGAEQDHGPGMPGREVRISRPFWLGRYPVTQGQWMAVMGNNPSAFPGAGPNAPVEQVNWDDVQLFLARLNTLQDTWTFRLPTRAELEYASHAGTEGEVYGPVDAIAWHNGNSGGTTHPVGQKLPNAFGLYDMIGNVLQLCQDWHGEADDQVSPLVDPQGPPSGSQRVWHGGSWYYDASFLGAGALVYGPPDMRSGSDGFRVVAAVRTPN